MPKLCKEIIFVCNERTENVNEINLKFCTKVKAAKVVDIVEVEIYSRSVLALDFVEYYFCVTSDIYLVKKN